MNREKLSIDEQLIPEHVWQLGTYEFQEDKFGMMKEFGGFGELRIDVCHCGCRRIMWRKKTTDGYKYDEPKYQRNINDSINKAIPICIPKNMQ